MEMFHIYTSMVAAIEEMNRSSKMNENLEIEKQELDLQLVSLESLRQENEYLKKKLKYAEEIEAAGSSQKKNQIDKGKESVNKEVLVVLQKVNAPLFKACEVNFSEEELIIKKEIVDEDEGKKYVKSTINTKSGKNPEISPVIKTPKTEVKNESTMKKMKNRNGKIGVNKSNNYVYVTDAPWKQCQKYGSTNHLTHLCKKTVSEPNCGSCKYNEAQTNDPYSFCDKFY
ncbi:hypothetical protein AgCh_022416 [Apium graveolens]